MDKFKKTAYTLAEVIIVMLIITVIVSVSIKITKAKLDNITSYTYYSAYKTVNSVTREMLKDFNAVNEEYTTSYIFPAAYARQCFYETDTGAGKLCCDYIVVHGSCNNYLSKEECKKTGLPTCPFEYDYYAYFVQQAGGYDKLGTISQLPLPEAWNKKSAELISQGITGLIGKLMYDKSRYFGCYAGYSDCTGLNRGGDSPFTFGKACDTVAVLTCDYIEDEPEDPQPPAGCTPIPCSGGNEFDAATCSCMCKKFAPAIVPCGKEWNQEQCTLTDITPWPPNCPAGQEFKDNNNTCGCVPITQTIPRKGANYCKLFVNYTNTAILTEDEECSGTQINPEENDFKDKLPDIILRNGMILYNVSQDPQKIEILNGNSKGVKFTKDDGTEVDIDEWGYTVYIDIDGAKGGESKLWEDVYPFYVTLSGKVIPAYDIDNPETAGGDSKIHLQTSVYDEFIENNKRNVQWITKSKSFKSSACTMQYIKSETKYCNGINKNYDCTLKNHDCKLKSIMPVKFTGY